MAVDNKLEHRLSLCLALTAIVLLLPLSAAFAQDSWEGNAAVIRRGEFSSPGFFAASDAFPLNSRVQVTNLQTGKQVDVTVVRRTGGAGTIFLLLSEQAAAQLGLSDSEVVRVRAAFAPSLDVRAMEPTSDSPYTTDPDLNPAASLDERQIAAIGSRLTTPAEPLEPVPQAEPASTPAGAAQGAPPPAVEADSPAPEAQAPSVAALAASEQQAAPEASPEAGATEQPAAAGNQGPAAEASTPPAGGTQQPALSAEQTRLERLSERLPQKQLFLPPRRQTLFALPASIPEPVPEETESAAQPAAAEAAETVAEEEPPVQSAPVPAEGEVTELAEEVPPEVVEEPVAVETAAAEEQPAEEPPTVSMVAPPGVGPQEDVEVELPGPGPAAVDEPSAEGTRLASPAEQVPQPLSAEIPIAAPTIPEEQPATPPEVAAPPATVVKEPAVEATALAGLPRRSYFVQLGAYSTKGLAEKLARQLTDRYEVIVLAADSGGRLFYKVLVGPLNRDESGTLLYQFRARGFKDAFVRYVE